MQFTFQLSITISGQPPLQNVLFIRGVARPKNPTNNEKLETPMLYLLSFFYWVYYYFIESTITFSFVCWFQSLRVKERNLLNKVVSISSKIIGCPQETLMALYKKTTV